MTRSSQEYPLDPKLLTLENGTTTTASYDDDGQLSQVSHENGGGVFARAGYLYDSVKRRTSETRLGSVTDTYGYDTADQVTSAGYGAGGSESFSYDAAGNRRTVNSSVTGSQFFGVANGRNEFTSLSVFGFEYDPLGNATLVRAGSTYELAYDCLSRLYFGKVSTSGIDGATTFTYDARNRRIQRSVAGTVTYSLYDGWNLIAEYDATGAQVARYVHGTGVDELLLKTDSAGSVYYHANGLGSTVALTDATGAVVERYTYSVYGVPTIFNAAGTLRSATAHGNRFLFTGREWFPSIRIYDYRNRAYSPWLGRFLQTDPIRFDAGDANLYRYVGNNPVNDTDPNGLMSESQCQELQKQAFQKQWQICSEMCEGIEKRRCFYNAEVDYTRGIKFCNLAWGDQSWGNQSDPPYWDDDESFPGQNGDSLSSD